MHYERTFAGCKFSQFQLLCYWEVVGSCVLLAENVMWESKREKTVKLSGAVCGLLGEWRVRKSCCRECEIYKFPCHLTGCKHKIYFYAGQVPLEFQTHGRSWKHRHVTTLSNEIPETNYYSCAKLFLFQ